MNRRRFLVMTTGGAVLVGAGAAGGVWLFCPCDSQQPGAAAQLDAIARSMSGAASAGRAWLEAHPAADPRAELLDSLAMEPRSSIDSDRLASAISDRVEEDFTQERLFRHDAWQLSQTEARLAALHVALLGAAASEASAPSFDAAPEAELVRLERYNPKQVVQGEILAHPGLPDNVIWFATAEPPPPRFRLYIDGTSLPTNASQNGFSVRVPDELRYRLFETPGEYPIWLYDPVVDRRQQLGALAVVAATASGGSFCDVDNWGPRETRVGEPFNEQPDGASAFWLRIECFPETTVVTLDGVEVPTTLRPGDGLITTHIKNHELYAAPGEYAVELLDKATGNRHPVGSLVVRP